MAAAKFGQTIMDLRLSDLYSVRGKVSGRVGEVFMLGQSTFGRIDKALFNALWIGEHCLGLTAKAKLRKRLADRMLKRVQSRPVGKLVPVDRLRNLSVEDFKSRYRN